MSESNGLRVMLGTWSQLGEQATVIRFDVFVQEQKVPVEEELDALDEHCVHALAFTSNVGGAVTDQAVATGRLLPDGNIGRMAVLSPYRRQGMGGAVLLALMNVAHEKGFAQVTLGAQLHARGFYAKHGFIEQGEVFLDANIEHILMKKRLDGSDI